MNNLNNTYENIEENEFINSSNKDNDDYNDRSFDESIQERWDD